MSKQWVSKTYKCTEWSEVWWSHGKLESRIQRRSRNHRIFHHMVVHWRDSHWSWNHYFRDGIQHLFVLSRCFLFRVVPWCDIGLYRYYCGSSRNVGCSAENPIRNRGWRSSREIIYNFFSLFYFISKIKFIKRKKEEYQEKKPGGLTFSCSCNPEQLVWRGRISKGF